MLGLAGFTVLAGVYSMVATGFALRASLQHNRSKYRTAAIIAFWATLTLFNVAFVALQSAYLFGADAQNLYVLYLVQTAIGAPSIVILVSIVFRALLPEWLEGFGTGFFTAVAMVTLALVINGGATLTGMDDWGLHYLPDLDAARTLVALAYVASPSVLAGLLFYSGQQDEADPATRNRFTLFGASVLVMFIPHAIQYVIPIQGILLFLLPAISGTGAWLGWRSYHAAKPEPSGNG